MIRQCCPCNGNNATCTRCSCVRANRKCNANCCKKCTNRERSESPDVPLSSGMRRFATAKDSQKLQRTQALKKLAVPEARNSHRGATINNGSSSSSSNYRGNSSSSSRSNTLQANAANQVTQQDTGASQESITDRLLLQFAPRPPDDVCEEEAANKQRWGPTWEKSKHFTSMELDSIFERIFGSTREAPESEELQPSQWAKWYLDT